MIRKHQPSFSLDEADLVASITRESFFDFIVEFWDIVIPEEPVWNWHMEYVARKLQKHAEMVFRGEPRECDLIFNVPPGTSKSTEISVMFPPWTWTRMPTARHICASYAQNLALDLGRKSRDIVQSEKYQACFPEIQLRKDQNTKGYFVNTEGGGRLAIGTGGMVTGFHAHFINIDDPLDPNAALSEADLEAVNHWMADTIPKRKVSKSVTLTTMIMQRLHQDDATGHRMLRVKDDPVDQVILPAEDSYPIQPEKLKRRYVRGYTLERNDETGRMEKKYHESKGCLDPIRMGPKVIRISKAEGVYTYAGQFGQQPVPPGGGMFKPERIKIEKAGPVRFDQNAVARYWDKAYSHESGAFTVGGKLGMVVRNVGSERFYQFWILDIVRGQWDSAAREEVMLQTAKLDGRAIRIGIEQEPAAGKQSAEGSVRNLVGFRAQAILSNKDKVLRADPMAAQVNAGAFSMIEADWNHDLIQELRYFPFSRYKDQVDALSGAFNMLVGKRVHVGAMA